MVAFKISLLIIDAGLKIPPRILAFQGCLGKEMKDV